MAELMSFQTNQVAEIIILALGERSASRGSGYLLFSHCVLTAFHVVKDCGDRPIHVRLLGTYQDDPSTWPSAEVVWKNPQLDLAILKWHSNYDNAVIKPRIKTLNLDRDHRCKAYGFPRYNVTSDGKGVDVDVLKGEIKSIQSPKSPGQLRIENLRSIPKSMDEWKGFSGGPVFSDGDLVGVIVKGPESLQGQRLEAIALDYVLNADLTLNQCLRNSFKQELLALDIDGIEASKLYDSCQALEALKLRRSLTDLACREGQRESSRIDIAIKRQEKQVAEQKGQSDIQVAKLPKRRLEDFLVQLVDLSQDHQTIFWQVLSSNVGFSRSLLQEIDVKQAFTLLFDPQDSDLLSRFLSELYVQLSQSDVRND
ncbi:MAG: serine protease, partial [Leptolyngbyaceae bacterium]|nr:serine protease [Leptolyngbyaceae bacterium]